MKRILIILLSLCACLAGAKAWDFGEPTIKGDTIYYTILNDTTVFFDVHNGHYKSFSEGRYPTDTLVLPEKVTHNGHTYNVTVNTSADNHFVVTLYNATKADPEFLYIPKTLFQQGLNRRFSDKAFILPGFESTQDRFQGYIVDKNHSTIISEDGMILSHNRDTLLLFPIGRRGTYQMPEYIKHYDDYCMIGTALDTLLLPEDMDLTFGFTFLYQAKNMKSFRYPNAVTRLDYGIGIYGAKLEEIILGSGLTYISTLDLNAQALFCLAVIPPEIKNIDYSSLRVKDKTLFIPRKSIGLYRQANGWKDFSAIEPIEPPVVAGVNEAEISWVTNAEASSYTLTIYLDEAQTTRLVTLSFDDRGYLTKMDFNPDVFKAPNRMPQEVKQLQEEDYPEFNKYLTFTVTGLTAHTKYYFVRQTLNAMSEVIDEESGSFETLPDGAPTGVNPLLFEPSPQKTFENGLLFIHKNGNMYQVNGTKVE